jgi:multiple sugar transport system substrate-binding protein
LIAGPPFVKALEEMAKTARLNSDGATELTPQQSVALVLSGKAAMAIGFLDRRTKGSPMNSIGIAELPGSDSAYHLGHAAWERRRSGEANQVTLRGIGGRVGSVVRGSEEAENAFMLLAWLSSKQTSQEIMSADVDFAPFRFSQLANSAAWISASLNPVEVNEYVKTFTAVLSRKEVLWVPRIPGANDYLAALDDAVRLAMTGEKTTQQALDSAAEQWRQITARYGVQQQLEAYRHSLKLPK